MMGEVCAAGVEQVGAGYTPYRLHNARATIGPIARAARRAWGGGSRRGNSAEPVEVRPNAVRHDLAAVGRVLAAMCLAAHGCARFRQPRHGPALVVNGDRVNFNVETG
jgi:hypothetical protein